MPHVTTATVKVFPALCRQLVRIAYTTCGTLGNPQSLSNALRSPPCPKVTFWPSPGCCLLSNMFYFYRKLVELQAEREFWVKAMEKVLVFYVHLVCISAWVGMGWYGGCVGDKVVRPKKRQMLNLRQCLLFSRRPLARTV